MSRTRNLRRRPDGGHDTEHYIDRARQLRSMEVYAMALAAKNAALRLILAQVHRMNLRGATGFRKQ